MGLQLPSLLSLAIMKVNDVKIWCLCLGVKKLLVMHFCITIGIYTLVLAIMEVKWYKDLMPLLGDQEGGHAFLHSWYFAIKGLKASKADDTGLAV